MEREDKSLGWYAGYVLALAVRDERELNNDERRVLNDLSVRLQGLHLKGLSND